MLLQSMPGRKTRGFTIVELIIVIAIIAILASLVIVSYRNLTKSAAKEAVKSDLKSAASQLESIRTANRSKNYPTSFPSGFETSPDVGIAITQTSANQFCLNGIHANYPDVKLRYDSVNGFGESHCSGAVVATAGAYEPQDPQDPEEPTYAANSVYGSTAQTFAGAVIPSSSLRPPFAVAQRFFLMTTLSASERGYLSQAVARG